MEAYVILKRDSAGERPIAASIGLSPESAAAECDVEVIDFDDALGLWRINDGIGQLCGEKYFLTMRKVPLFGIEHFTERNADVC